MIVLTRDPMGRYLNAVLAAPVTSTVRGTSTEVAVGPDDGIRRPSVANLDNLQLVPRHALRRPVGAVGRRRSRCCATRYAPLSPARDAVGG